MSHEISPFGHWKSSLNWEYINPIVGERNDCIDYKLTKNVGVIAVLRCRQATYISMLGLWEQRRAAPPEIVTTPQESTKDFSFTKRRVVQRRSLACNSKRILSVAFFIQARRLELWITSSYVLFRRRWVTLRHPWELSSCRPAAFQRIFPILLIYTNFSGTKKKIPNSYNWEVYEARKAAKKAERTIVNDRQALRSNSHSKDGWQPWQWP